MVYLVTESWLSPKAAAEAGNVYLEVIKKYPDDKSIFKPIIPNMINTRRDGLHSIGIYEIKPGKVKEALDIGNNRMLFITSKLDVKYTLRIYYNLIESLSLIGLETP